MPLTATVNGDEVVATKVSADDWAAYKGRKPWPVLSCGRDGHAKTSKLGTQFFAHAPKVNCDAEHKGETPEHRQVKAAIITVATNLGWNARAEVPADNRSWIADVLVERDGRRIAFEVQLSGQVEGGYQHRQQRYTAEGIECYWLTRRATPAELRQVPALHVRVKDTDPDITVAAQQRSTDRRPLETFVAAVLNGDLRWAPEATAPQDAAVRWGIHRCIECDQYSVTWDADEHGTVHCGRCLVTQAGHTIRGAGEPRRFKAARGVTAPSAPHRTSWLGEREFRCSNCPNILPTLAGPGGDYVRDVATLREATLRGHWCAPEGALATPADVIGYLDGVRRRPSPAPADTRTVIELTAAADRRYNAAKAAAAVREEQRLTQIRSARWRADQMAQALTRLEADAARRGDSSTQFLNRLRERAAAAELDAYLAESGKTGPSGPIPPWWGQQPEDAHQRTTAIDQYTQKHLREVPDLIEVFPPMPLECVCHPCRVIHEQFDRHQRKLLWPGRSAGRNLHPGRDVPRTSTV
ncbi:hypothetical protein [Curtobacterium sp. MCSS17_016]|uniref:competence protein CoiA n=1 Tax=Curtobacterium sp. MCSS17_016 TaxID=2175644 RepID=UPI0024E037B5|nr:hypothetical protein [Curtobacterium sp. MCSS17_016]WIE81229.1 hypothetical protein DEJ19_018520 [Curtobacterium sp. MCSS17_016]